MKADAGLSAVWWLALWPAGSRTPWVCAAPFRSAVTETTFRDLAGGVQAGKRETNAVRVNDLDLLTYGQGQTAYLLRLLVPKGQAQLGAEDELAALPDIQD